jgi:hypothetical protein
MQVRENLEKALTNITEHIVEKDLFYGQFPKKEIVELYDSTLKQIFA